MAQSGASLSPDAAGLLAKSNRTSDHTARIHVLTCRGSYAVLNQKLGQELAADVEILDLLLQNVSLVLKVAELKEMLGKGCEQVKLSALFGSAADSHDVMKTKDGKDALQHLRQRVLKLEEKLSEPQKELRKVCRQMNFQGATSRPSWANGAHIFVTAEVADVADELQRAIEEGGLGLGKGCIVVSAEHLKSVEDALSHEKKLSWSRSGELELGPIVRVHFRSGPESLSTRRTHTTGEIPNEHMDREGRVWNGEKALGKGAHAKSFSLSHCNVALNDTELSCESEDDASSAFSVETADFAGYLPPSGAQFKVRTSADFANCVEKRMIEFVDVAGRFFEDVLLETQLAQSFSGEGKPADGAQFAFKHLGKCLRKLVLLHLLAGRMSSGSKVNQANRRDFGQSCERFADWMVQEVAQTSESLVDKKNGLPDGAHAAADRMKAVMMDSIGKFCANLKSRHACLENCWTSKFKTGIAGRSQSSSMTGFSAESPVLAKNRQGEVSRDSAPLDRYWKEYSKKMKKKLMANRQLKKNGVLPGPGAPNTKPNRCSK